MSRSIFILSWVGAVVFPVLCFVLAFILAVVGMNLEVALRDANQEHLKNLMGGSAFMMVSGFLVLLIVIRAVDSAARRVPLPEFEVYFEFPEHVLQKTMIMKRNERRAGTRIVIHNKGEDVADDVECYVMFPRVFKINKLTHYTVSELGAESSFPERVSAKFCIERIHVDVKQFFSIDFIAPDAVKTYDVIVCIEERKTGMSDHRLAIQVVD